VLINGPRAKRRWLSAAEKSLIIRALGAAEYARLPW